MQKTLNNTYFILSLLLFVYILFSLKYSPPFEVLGVDREIFQYIGMLINNNKVPYIDVYDNKPPLIYIFNYLGVLLTPNSTWGIYLIMNALGFISAILIYRIAFKKFNNLPLSIVITIIYISCINNNDILEGGNLTRQITTYFNTIIAYVIFLNKTSKFKYILSGILISCILFSQQNEILSGLVIISYGILFKNDFIFFSKKELIRNSCYFTLGLLVACITTISILIYWNCFDLFLEQTFFFNLNTYVEKKSFLFKLWNVILKFAIISVKSISLIILIAIISIKSTTDFINKKKLSPELIVLIISLLAQIISTSISGKTFGHYFLMFIPIIILIFIYSININDTNHLKHHYLIMIGLVLVATLKNISFENKEDKYIGEITNHILTVKNIPGQFYSFETKYLRINYNLNIVSPSKYVYVHFNHEKRYNEISEDLNYNNTKYVLFKKSISKEIPKKLNQLLFNNYKKVLNNEEYILYEIKNIPH